MTEQEKEILVDKFSKVMAANLVHGQAYEQQIRLIEKMAGELHLVMSREYRNAINGMLRAFKTLKHYNDYFTDLAMSAAITEKGEQGTIGTYDTLQNDASIENEVFLWLANARHNDDDAHLKVISYLKFLCNKADYIIEPEIINKLKVKI